MNNGLILKNLGVAFLAQGISMVLSIITSLVVPKVLGMTDFGYWQLFIFYMAYTGFASLGVNDGTYLIIGGQRRAQVDKRATSSQFIVSSIYEILIAGVIFIAAFWGSQDEQRTYVLVATGVMLVFLTATFYIGWILQAVNETKTYSQSLIVNRVSFLVMLVPLLLARVPDFRWYVAAFVAAQFFMLCYCLAKGHSFISAKPYPPLQAVSLTIASIKRGSVLALASASGMLIMGVARFIVDATYPIEVFGAVSLALSLATFLLSFISQIGMVLFPALRQATSTEMLNFFQASRDTSSILLPFMYLLYIPLSMFVLAWLPDYSDSIALFSLVIPICVFDGKMQIVFSTYFKVLNKEKQLLAMNAIALALSAIGCVVGIYIFSSIPIALMAMTIAFVARSLMSELYLNKQLNVGSSATFIGELIMMMVFITTIQITSSLWSFSITLGVYALCLIANRRCLIEAINRVR